MALILYKNNIQLAHDFDKLFNYDIQALILYKNNIQLDKFISLLNKLLFALILYKNNIIQHKCHKMMRWKYDGVNPL